MFKHLAAAILAANAFAGASAQSADLTDLEQRWLQAAAPVLSYSQQLALPIDIVVQPRPRANDVPLAMGYDGGRCKLVLTLRGNPQAETILDGQTGAVVPLQDFALFERKVLAYVDDPELTKQHGLNARAHVDTAYNVVRYSKEFAQHIARFL